MHGTVMIFLFIIPMLAGFGNYVVPLQIGAPDMAFPRINALSFWMLPLGGILLFLGFVTGGAAQAGWTSYSPLAQDRPLGSTGPGQDLWIMALTLIGTSSILGADQLPRDDLQDAGAGHDAVPDADPRLDGPGHERPRADGDAGLHERPDHAVHRPQLRRPLLRPERPAATRSSGRTCSGSTRTRPSTSWSCRRWASISEILPVFCRKPLFGYKAFVFATAGIGALGFSVWAHHMFTTGAVYLPFFSLMTFLIAVPTGVKMFNWIFTMCRGKLTFSTPLLFALGFLTMFLIGGINGAFSAAVPVDFALHDTYWVVAHLHYVLFGGSVFGVLAGLYYWFPKMTGRMLNEGLGKVQFVLMFIGFNLTFFPMHQLGLAGMPRRIADYAANAGWNDLNLAATIGGFMIAASMIPFLWNVFISLRDGKIAGDDPWEANTLEWATSSPPPPYNFDRLPEIRSERPLFDLRHGRTAMRHVDGRSTPPAPLESTTGDPGHAVAEHSPVGGPRPRRARRDQQPDPRDDPVHLLGGDVLLGAVRGLLQRPGRGAAWPPIVASDQALDRALQPPRRAVVRARS